MYYTFNSSGWYTGASESATTRSTEVLPPSLSIDETPGKLRANYGGVPGEEWSLEPYVVPTSVSVEFDYGAAWEAIKAERDRRTLKGGYQVDGYWFHSDVFSRIQQLGLLQLTEEQLHGTLWKTMNGSFTLMTPFLAQRIFVAAALSDMAHFAYAEQLRGVVESSNNPAGVNLYAGWPAIYGE